MTTATGLDHVGVCARAAEPLWAAYEALGFRLTPPSQHRGLATGNRCAMLRHGYLELLAIRNPGLPDNGLGARLDRHEGLHILALTIEETSGNLARLGLAEADIAWLEREAEGGLARFARVPLPEAPEGRIQLIQHLTPDLLWCDPWMDHPNHAVALIETILVSPDPAASAARLSRLAGLPLRPDAFAGFALPLPDGGLVRILPAEALEAVLPGLTPPSLPWFAAMVLRTDDANDAAGRLPVRPVPGGLLVDPARAGGVALVFAA